MLNLSKNSIRQYIDTNAYESFALVRDNKTGRVFKRMLITTSVLLGILLFLPWTQNIRAKGYLTTLMPDQRPQAVNSVIPGKIEKWFVREGNFVKAGDTLLFLSEIKDDYFDPNLVGQTSDQVSAKKQSIKSYQSKITALQQQLAALKETRIAKLTKAQNYLNKAALGIVSDSTDMVAAQLNKEIAERQFRRIETLHEQGLKSLTDLENGRQKAQNAAAKETSAINKFNASKNEYQAALAEISSIENEYKDKIAKAESELYSTESMLFEGQASLSKQEIQLSNYSIRSSNYYLRAPQDGYVNKLLKAGIGEIVKEGEQIAQIMPTTVDLAVAMYVEPRDMPLIDIGERVQFIFDGWPTIAFSGWPNLSYGTFPGRIIAIDQYISENNKYRILVVPDPDSDQQWPEQLRVGSGARGIALLNDVPVWYEIWRQLNGFPPDYYRSDKSMEKKEK